MAKIHVMMANSEEFTISNAFYGSSGPMDSRGAQVQGGFLLSKMVSVGTDQGPVINVPQIAYYWTED